MNQLIVNLIIAAVTLVVAAGSAAAQTMKAEIPFPFRAGKVVLAPGTYQISWVGRPSGSWLFRLADRENHKALLLLPVAASEGTPGLESGMLSFQCGVSRCSLSGLSVGRGTPEFRMPPSRLGRDDRIVVGTKAD